MKMKLTCEQRAARAGRMAFGFDMLFVAGLCATVACGLAAGFYLSWLMLGAFCLCLFTTIGLRGLAVHFQSKARDLELQKFEETCKSCSATDIADANKRALDD